MEENIWYHYVGEHWLSLWRTLCHYGGEHVDVTMEENMWMSLWIRTYECHYGGEYVDVTMEENVWMSLWIRTYECHYGGEHVDVTM